ncbi:glycoside hydrolase family 2 TIM barrel-domain containing protein [Kiritimatiellaeota bacterium B1221]|nr:glycoside hydrolase family 2 TIM barrel-domain containing protein [Kiritimatiellaeota bacterium B1221]
MQCKLPENQRHIETLDGMWDFAFLGETETPECIEPSQIKYDDRMPVPSAYDAYPRYAGVRGTAAYRTFLNIPSQQSGFLRLWGTGMWNRIILDGEELKTYSLPYSPVELSIPASDQTRRELVIINDNRFDAQRVPLQEYYYDFYAYGGIYRSIELHLPAPLYITEAHINPEDHQSGKVQARVWVNDHSLKSLSLQVWVDESQNSQHEIPLIEGAGSFSFQIENPQPWTAETPNLYKISLKTDRDNWETRIGFRTITVENGKVQINGKAVKLLGYCHHEAHPQFGPALSVQSHVQDLQLMKDMGCNFIRGSHYPMDPVFLDLCDELGFYVFQESLGWGNREKNFESEGFHQGQLEQTKKMIHSSWNHPCVIMWGYLNEGASNEKYAGPLYQELYKLCKSEDPTRPATYASMFPFEDLYFEYCDVISINHYPGWYSKRDQVRPLHEIDALFDRMLDHFQKIDQADKPFIMSEIGAGAIYGWRDALKSHWSEEYQADHLDVVCKRVVEDDRITGVSLWQFCDGRTYASAEALQRPRAFNNKGTFDEYRRPKLAYQTVKNHFTSSKE